MDLRPRERCPQPSDVVVADERGLFCHACDHTVLDLTRTTRREAEALVTRALETRERVCRRVAVDRETGEMVFARDLTARARVRLPLVAAMALPLAACASMTVPTASTASAVGVTQSRAKESESSSQDVARIAPDAKRGDRPDGGVDGRVDSAVECVPSDAGRSARQQHRSDASTHRSGSGRSPRTMEYDGF